MSETMDVLRQALPQAGHGTWYSIKNLDTKATVRIYEEIGLWGVTASDFARDLDAITSPEIEVQISSPGGDVFDGIAIYNALRAHPATVTTRVDGLAASAASVIVQAGDKRVMLSGSQMMIHEAWGLAIGSATEMRDYADLLERQSDVLAGIYAERSGREADEFRSLMATDTWLTDQEAVESGLADEVVSNPQAGLRAPQSLFVAKAMATRPDMISAVVPHEVQEAPMEQDTITPEEHAAIVVERDDLKAQVEALTAEVATLKPAAPEAAVDITALPEPVQAALREAEALKARVERMESENRTKAFATKAADFPHIAGAAELGPVLDAVDRAAPEAAKALDQYLKAANARIAESGLFGEIGSDTAENGDDPVAKAQALIAREVEAGLSRPDAIRKVFSEHPELVSPARAVAS